MSGRRTVADKTSGLSVRRGCPTLMSGSVIMFRLVAVSVRGPKYLIGNSSVHPVDGPVPSGEGTGFASIVDAQRYTRRELGSLSVYHMVHVVDADGVTVVTGSRAGRGGTGKTWTWRNAQ